MDIWIIKETCLDRDYEVHGTNLEDGWTVLDIGAGLGDFSIYAARKVKEGLVYAYEPFPESFDLLQENLELNGITNVLAFPVAINSSGQELLLSLETKVPVRHSTSVHTVKNSIQVRGTTLGEVMGNIGHCDLLKLDCEGAEYDILLNAHENTLSRIHRISMEYHNGLTEFSQRDLVEFLAQHNFSVRVAPNPAHKEIGFLYAFKNDLTT